MVEGARMIAFFNLGELEKSKTVSYDLRNKRKIILIFMERYASSGVQPVGQ